VHLYLLKLYKTSVPLRMQVKSVRIKSGKHTHSGCGIDGEFFPLNGQVISSLLPEQCRLIGRFRIWLVWVIFNSLTGFGKLVYLLLYEFRYPICLVKYLVDVTAELCKFFVSVISIFYCLFIHLFYFDFIKRKKVHCIFCNKKLNVLLISISSNWSFDSFILMFWIVICSCSVGLLSVSGAKVRDEFGSTFKFVLKVIQG
jgi:hypothetical protein